MIVTPTLIFKKRVLQYLNFQNMLWYDRICHGAKNTTSTHTLEIITESPPNFIYSKRKGKILIKLLKEKENGRRNQIRIQELIMQGKSISTSHIRCTQRELLSYICD